MSDSFNGIQVFIASVESGSFSAAAVRMNLTRSAVTKTIARMEARLNVRLFHRTTRRLSLTDDGHIYYEQCLKALENIHLAEHILDSGRYEASGRLRVTMPVLYGRYWVAPLLTKLTQAHPKLELDLSFNDRFVDLIEEGFDLAIRGGSLGSGTGLMTRRVGVQHMRVCASPSYIATNGAPKTLDDLKKHHSLVYNAAGRKIPWVFPETGQKPQEIIPPGRLTFNDMESIADAAMDGFGLAWLPCWLIQDRVKAGQLVPVLTNHQQQTRDIYAVWPHSPHQPLRLRIAIDALAAHLPNLNSS